MFCTYIHPHFWSLPNQKRPISKEEPGPVSVKIGNLVQSGRCDQRWILGIGNLDAIGIQNLQETKKMLGQYCWWKKSCTTWHVWNPVNSGIFRYIWHINWCTFFPSTVWQMPLLVLPFIYFWPNIDRDFLIWKKLVLSTYPPFEWFRPCVSWMERGTRQVKRSERIRLKRGALRMSSCGSWRMKKCIFGWHSCNSNITKLGRNRLGWFWSRKKKDEKIRNVDGMCVSFWCVFWLIHTLIHVSWIFDEALLVDRWVTATWWP